MKSKSSQTWMRRLATPLVLSIATLSLGGAALAQAGTSVSAGPMTPAATTLRVEDIAPPPGCCIPKKGCWCM